MKKYLFLFFVIISSNVHANEQRITHGLKTVFSEYELNKNVLNRDQSKLYEFVNQHVSPSLSISNIARALLQERWTELSSEQKRIWMATVNRTITRYTMKLVGEYGLDGIDWDKLILENRSKGFSHLKLPVQTKLPLKLSVELLIRHNKKRWAIVDFSALNFSFISLKGKEYRKYLSLNSFESLVKLLEHKNNLYFCEFTACPN
jgi:ABC-type transporter MlaC component